MKEKKPKISHMLISSADPLTGPPPPPPAYNRKSGKPCVSSTGVMKESKFLVIDHFFVCS